MGFKKIVKDILRPAYYIFRDTFDFAGKRRLAKNRNLKDRYYGKRAFLLLTGESLAHVDITRLKNEYTFGAGFIFLHDNIRDIDLDFYMDLDSAKTFKTMLTWPAQHLGPLNTADGLGDFYRAIDTRLTDKTELFLNSNNCGYIQSNAFFKNKTLHFLKARHNLHVDVRRAYGDMADLTQRRISGSSALFYSLFILMYMGFKEIYLCGAGYTYEPIYGLHFYDNFVFPKDLGIECAERDARKALSKRYPGMAYRGLYAKDNSYRTICSPKKDFLYNRQRHKRFHEYALSQGVNIYNIVPDGFESRVFPEVDLNEVLDQKPVYYQETVGA